MHVVAQCLRSGYIIKYSVLPLVPHQLQTGARKAVDKQQDKFSLKKMIELLHIKEPAEHVMAVLGKRCVCVCMDSVCGCVVVFSQLSISDKALLTDTEQTLYNESKNILYI